MDERAVENERNGDGDIHQRETIEEKDAGPLRDGSDPVKGEEEQDEPQHGVDGFDGEFRRREEERE